MSLIVTDSAGIVREFWNYDISPRTVIFYDASGVQTTTRNLTATENASVDAGVAQTLLSTNQGTVLTALDDALVSLQVIIDDTNANINGNPAQRIKDVCRALRRVIRVQRNNYTGTT